jgi:hypothetical protein
MNSTEGDASLPNDPEVAARDKRAQLSDAAILLKARIRLYLCGPISRRRGYAYPSQKELARDLGWSVRKVKRYVRELRDAGEMKVERPDRRYRNQYRLPDPAAPAGPASEGTDLSPPGGQDCLSERDRPDSTDGTDLAPRRGQDRPLPRNQEEQNVKNKTQQQIAGAAARGASLPQPQQLPATPAHARHAEAKAALQSAGLDSAKSTRLANLDAAQCLRAVKLYAEVCMRDERRGRPGHHGLGFLIACIEHPTKCGWTRHEDTWLYPQDSQLGSAERERNRAEAKRRARQQERLLEERAQWDAVDPATRQRIEALVGAAQPGLQPGVPAHIAACLGHWQREQQERLRANREADEASKREAEARQRAKEAAAEAAWESLDAADRDLLRRCIVQQWPELAKHPPMLDATCRSQAKMLYQAEQEIALWQRMPVDVQERAEKAAGERWPLFRGQSPHWLHWCLTCVDPGDLRQAREG